MMVVKHSGMVFLSTHKAPSRDRALDHLVSVWPISEYLARTKHKPTVAARIRRLNPNGKPEGDRPRGWNPKGPSAQQRKRWSRR